MLRLHRTTWVCLLLACIGANWFTYQCFLVPQNARFVPNWASSQWVCAQDSLTAEKPNPVAYFRHVTNLNTLPDAAFVTVAASQVFRLYINGTFVGSNAIDFAQGAFPAAYIYDVVSLLQPGSNVVALRVANADEQPPAVRVNFGIVRGNAVNYTGSNSSWQATAQSVAVYPRYSATPNAWTTKNFDASSWPLAQASAPPPGIPLLGVNPLLYEQPLISHWISAGDGHDAYFVRQFALPPSASGAWLRLAATGTASIFINGHLLMIWNGQAPVNRQSIASYLSDDGTPVQYRHGLALGAYDISPDLRSGLNTIAVHVVAPGNSAAQVGLDNLSAAMSLDILTGDPQNHPTWSNSDAPWHASARPVEGWASGNSAALRWPRPLPVGRPGASRLFYLPDATATTRDIQVHPFIHISEMILLSTAGVLLLWLLVALAFIRYCRLSSRQALEMASLAYLPAFSCEALLVVLSREPQIPRPFPYTWPYGLALVMLALGSSFLLWLNARKALKQPAPAAQPAEPLRERLLTTYFASSLRVRAIEQVSQRLQTWKHLTPWLRLHWPIILLVVIAIPLISYNLSYEPYWQDELSSFYAAHGVLAHGLPFFPSGFLYEKAELYSYLLAAWTLLAGDQAAMPRFISVAEYLVSIPLLYSCGSYFFERRVALLAAAMLAFSPISLVWGRQVRMYEQAQLLTLLVLYAFYKVRFERQRVYLIYLAMLCLVADYLSHEETFIILPALLICMLVTSRDAQHRLPAVLYQKHWWYAALAGGTIIAIQWLLTRVTHPPILGTDSSQRPFIQLTTDNIPYYFDLLFFPSVLSHGTLPWITVNSLLATAGCLWARRDTNLRAKYCALFLLLSFCTLMLVFTMQADRYFYPLLPVYYLMGAYAMVHILRACWTFARPRVVLARSDPGSVPVLGGYLSRPLSLLAIWSAALICAAVLIVPILPLSSYNLFISRLVRFSYHRHYPDYDAAGRYMQQHWRKGDVVISVAPDFSTFYYTGHVNYFFSIDRALFLLERDGHIIDTSLGAPALLNQDDFQAILSAHPRVWIISDNATYQAQAAKRFTFPPDFRIVFEGYGSAVYLRGG